MFLLRAVDNRNAFVAATFNKQSAKEQLTYPLNSPTSVFEVEDVAMADRISVIHGMSFKAQPEDLDYILLPVDLVRGFGLRACGRAEGARPQGLAREDSAWCRAV